MPSLYWRQQKSITKKPVAYLGYRLHLHAGEGFALSRRVLILHGIIKRNTTGRNCCRNIASVTIK